MNDQLVRRFREVGTTEHKQQAILDAARVLGGVSEKPLTVRSARDAFSRIMREARSGNPQVIGSRPDDMAVVISLTDLVDIVREASRPKSLAAYLEEMDFDPVPESLRLDIAPERSEPSPEFYRPAPSPKSGGANRTA